MLLRGAVQAGNEQLSRNGQQPWLDYVVCGGDAALVDGTGTEEESLDAKAGAVSGSLYLLTARSYQLIQNHKLQNLLRESHRKGKRKADKER